MPDDARWCQMMPDDARWCQIDARSHCAQVLPFNDFCHLNQKVNLDWTHMSFSGSGVPQWHCHRDKMGKLLRCYLARPGKPRCPMVIPWSSHGHPMVIPWSSWALGSTSGSREVSTVACGRWSSSPGNPAWFPGSPVGTSLTKMWRSRKKSTGNPSSRFPFSRLQIMTTTGERTTGQRSRTRMKKTYENHWKPTLQMMCVHGVHLNLNSTDIWPCRSHACLSGLRRCLRRLRFASGATNWRGS